MAGPCPWPSPPIRVVFRDRPLEGDAVYVYVCVWAESGCCCMRTVVTMLEARVGAVLGLGFGFEGMFGVVLAFLLSTGTGDDGTDVTSGAT